MFSRSEFCSVNEFKAEPGDIVESFGIYAVFEGYHERDIAHIYARDNFRGVVLCALETGSLTIPIWRKVHPDEEGNVPPILVMLSKAMKS